MHCSKCGSSNPENAKFCKNCGAKLKQRDSKKSSFKPLSWWENRSLPGKVLLTVVGLFILLILFGALLSPGITALSLGNTNISMDDKSTQYTLNGTTNPNATVTISSIELNLTDEITADNEGKFTYTINIPLEIIEANATITAKAKDKENSTKEIVIQRPLTPLTINLIPQLNNETTSVTIEGKTDGQAAIKLTSNELGINNVTIQPDTNGNFKYELEIPVNIQKASISIESKSLGKKSHIQTVDIVREIKEAVNTNNDNSNSSNTGTGENSDNPTSTSSNGQTYVASINSDVFHYPWCYHVNSIKASNLITFNSRDAASASRRPCKDCNP